jgi:hypothetical protein
MSLSRKEFPRTTTTTKSLRRTTQTSQCMRSRVQMIVGMSWMELRHGNMKIYTRYLNGCRGSTTYMCRSYHVRSTPLMQGSSTGHPCAQFCCLTSLPRRLKCTFQRNGYELLHSSRDTVTSRKSRVCIAKVVQKLWHCLETINHTYSKVAMLMMRHTRKPLMLSLYESRVILRSAVAGMLDVPDESMSIFSRHIPDGISILRCSEFYYRVFVFMMNGLGGQE